MVAISSACANCASPASGLCRSSTVTVARPAHLAAGVPLREDVAGPAPGGEVVLSSQCGQRAETMGAVTFEQALAVLHGWLGRELEVAVLSCGEGSEMVATLAGRLVAGSDLSVSGGRDGALYFQLDGVGGSGFFIGPQTFRAAEWQDEERTVLAVDVGSVRLLVDSSA